MFYNNETREQLEQLKTWRKLRTQLEKEYKDAIEDGIIPAALTYIKKSIKYVNSEIKKIEDWKLQNGVK